MKSQGKSQGHSRRRFLQTTAGLGAAASTPYFFTGGAPLAAETKAEAKNDRPLIGCIGTGSRWNAVGPNAMKFGDAVAVCDVDAKRAAGAKAKSGGKADVYEDYRKVLDRKDVEIVTIVTPDHWHSKIAIEALQAGKDVYCEKPLTLTIEEGKQLVQVVRDTKRVLQVGTQQRSEMGKRFLLAMALVREGRIGDVKKVQCAIGGSRNSGPLEKTDPPSGLNWDLWQGQTTAVDYIPRRCHYEFRWWYEYSGGKMTDWGAHHVDIAQWAIGMTESGPTKIEPVMAEHPVPFKDGMPTLDNQYNAATKFLVKCDFPNGVEMTIRHDTDNGILFEGTKGRFFVSRGKIAGKPVEDLKDNPLPEDAIAKIYGGKEPAQNNAHMQNFFECVKTRQQPISDVFSHHRILTTCHLANIAIRLGRTLNWDPQTEQMTGDDDANSWQSRAQRKGYEIEL